MKVNNLLAIAIASFLGLGLLTSCATKTEAPADETAPATEQTVPPEGAKNETKATDDDLTEEATKETEEKTETEATEEADEKAEPEATEEKTEETESQQ